MNGMRLGRYIGLGIMAALPTAAQAQAVAGADPQGSGPIVAALAWGALLGVLGALLAIPVAAGLLLLYEEVLVPRQNHA